MSKGRRSAPVVLVALAHPDDESFGTAGTIAKLTAGGSTVHLLVGTRGESGEINVSAFDVPSIRRNLGRIRVHETAMAAIAMGAEEPAFLDHRDGTLEGVPETRLATEIASHIRAVRPDVIITFGPDGIYGHPDHVAMGRAVQRAWSLAAEEAPLDPIGSAAPSDLGAWTAERLFWQVLPQSWADEIARDRGPMVLDGTEHPFVGYPDDEITTRVDVGDVLDIKLAAIAAHHTQTAHMMDDMHTMLSDGPAEECFILAESRSQPPPGVATDVVAGIG